MCPWIKLFQSSKLFLFYTIKQNLHVITDHWQKVPIFDISITIKRPFGHGARAHEVTQGYPIVTIAILQLISADLQRREPSVPRIVTYPNHNTPRSFIHKCYEWMNPRAPLEWICWVPPVFLVHSTTQVRETQRCWMKVLRRVSSSQSCGSVWRVNTRLVEEGSCASFSSTCRLWGSAGGFGEVQTCWRKNLKQADLCFVVWFS